MIRLVPLVFTALVLLVVPEWAAAQHRRGQVSSAPCPYSCRSQGIPKSQCRDWREGDVCFIEDLRKPANSREGHTAQQPPRPRTPGWSKPVPGGDTCDAISAHRIPRPRIILSRIKASRETRHKYYVYGTVEGTCLSEAAVYEKGRRDESIPVTTVPQFQTFDFKVPVRADRGPEIRVYTVQGLSDRVRVDPSNFGSDGYGHDDDDGYYRHPSNHRYPPGGGGRRPHYPNGEPPQGNGGFWGEIFGR